MNGSPRTPLRIGAVSYLNTKPLVYRLAEFAPQAELLFDLPSRLADRLAAGELEIALIPAIEFFQQPGYRQVSDACIACRGPVLSVKLFSRVPLKRIRTLALDEGSRTSAALVQILLRERYGLAPACVPLPIGGQAADVDTDAVLLIGDRAIHAGEEGYTAVWDLGEEWCRQFGLPFVFALWVARPGVLGIEPVEEALTRARDEGREHLEEIARREAPAVGLTAPQTLAYLRDNLHFVLGKRERQGLERFRRSAAALGLAPAAEHYSSSPKPVLS